MHFRFSKLQYNSLSFPNNFKAISLPFELKIILYLPTTTFKNTKIKIENKITITINNLNPNQFCLGRSHA